jgi:hypothetical protein
MTTTSLRDLATTPTARLLTGEGSGATAWVVALGRDLYLRAVPGAAPFSGGRAHVRVSGTDVPVVLTEVAPEVHGPLDDAYRAKYGRCTPEKVSLLTSDAVAATTFRIGARRSTWAERVAATRAAVRDRRRVARAARVTGRSDDVPCVSC